MTKMRNILKTQQLKTKITNMKLIKNYCIGRLKKDNKLFVDQKTFYQQEIEKS